MIDLYRQMESANIETIHRELAHDQMTEVYEALTMQSKSVIESYPEPISEVKPAAKETPVYAPVSEPIAPVEVVPVGATRFSSREIMLIGVFVLLIGVVAFVKPEFIGLATLDTGLSVPVDTTFTTSGSMDIKLGAAPTSLKVTGTITGDGVARVYLVTSQGRQLVFDSALSPVESRNGVRHFDDICLDTCYLQGASADVKLQVELQNSAVLTIKSLQYSTKTSMNNPPVWLGQETTLTLGRNTPTTLDLSSLFSDSDGDALGFIATESQGLQVTVTGPQVTFQASGPGSYETTLIASDGQTATRVPFTLTVQ
jgi:hypothetical protein